jgi:1-phosphatidylinositol-3-phosphate 5-kinase
MNLKLIKIIDTQGFPIPLNPLCKKILNKSIQSDTSFLSRQNIVDYSILLGIDEEKKEIVMGIIDYLHQYTWDKQIETGVKSLGKIAGQSTPTVISPESYKNRFIEAMQHYFMAIPDQF